MNLLLETLNRRQFIAMKGLSLAANAGATTLTKVSVPQGQIAIIRARVLAIAGQDLIATVASIAANVLTSTAHGFLTGAPVYVRSSGTTLDTTLPTGVTAVTTYYVNAVDANSVKLYDTQAHAVSGGGTGLITISGGTNVYLQGVAQTGVYLYDCAVANRGGNLALVGSAVKDAFEDVAAWDFNVVADNTSQSALIQGTPDTVQATRFRLEIEVQLVSMS